jgi:tetratricopeptide (TPR) repeat protein
MKKVDFSYFIERYNAGEMSDEEKIWFRKEMEFDENLRQEVHLRKNTDEVIKRQDILALRNKLSEIERKQESKIHVRTRKNRVGLKYAAVIAGLIIIGAITVVSEKNTTSEKIIDSYYKSYEPVTNLRSGQSETNADFTLALDYYYRHEYRNAALYFSKVLEKDPGNIQSTFLNGVSNFEDKRYPEAKQSFVNVINDNNNLFIENAKWYLALCYLKTNEMEKAVKQLGIIKDEGGIYSNDAKKIIRKLK